MKLLIMFFCLLSIQCTANKEKLVFREVVEYKNGMSLYVKKYNDTLYVKEKKDHSLLFIYKIEKLFLGYRSFFNPLKIEDLLIQADSTYVVCYQQEEHCVTEYTISKKEKYNFEIIANGMYLHDKGIIYHSFYPRNGKTYVFQSGYILENKNLDTMWSFKTEFFKDQTNRIFPFVNLRPQ